MSAIREQLELLGFDEAVRCVEAGAATPPERRRARARVEVAHALLSELPTQDEIAFLHSGLCQTCLPHSRLASDRDVWRRQSGRFTLIVQPGVIDATPMPTRGRQPTQAERDTMYVGVPYGPRARLILIYLQSEGVRNRVVPMGNSMSAWIRSLGLSVTGGERGTIQSVREQSLRISRCSFTLQWTERDGNGTEVLNITDTRIVDGAALSNAVADAAKWPTEVLLSERFHDHLKQHAVPLDRRAIAHLSGNSLGLDLYALFAYRLPRLRSPIVLRWAPLRDQLGADYPDGKTLARKIRAILPDVLHVYPDALIDVSRYGLVLKPSKPAVPRIQVQGLRLVSN
jgi:hypothetical protein